MHLSDFRRCIPQKPLSTNITYSKTVKVSDSVIEVCKRLILDDVEMSQVMYKFLQDVNSGLSNKENTRSPVKCLVTYVQNLPNGKERGRYLALDLSSSNFRIVLVDLDINTYDMQSKMYNIPQNLLTGTGEQLFSYIAECLSLFCMDFNVTQEESVLLALTFGFPVEQRSLNSGILLRWSKGFMCTETVGRDVVKMLQDAIERRGDLLIDVVALVAETTGTLMACAWKNHRCRVGVVIGSNITYIELKEKVPGFNDEFGARGNPYVMVNVDCAGFGDDGCLDFIRTEFDKEIDQHSANPGKQIYEKIVSGTNMGEVVRLILIHCIKSNAIFGGKVPEGLLQRGHFYTKYVSEIECDNVGTFNNCKGILEDLGVKHFSEQDMVNLRYICESISKRSAYLMSACVATLIRKMHFPSITIAIDGLIYRFHPHYHNLLMDKIRQLCSGGVRLHLMPSEDGGGRGAAITAAVAARFLDKTELAAKHKPVVKVKRPTRTISQESVVHSSITQWGSASSLMSFLQETPDSKPCAHVEIPYARRQSVYADRQSLYSRLSTKSAKSYSGKTRDSPGDSDSNYSTQKLGISDVSQLTNHIDPPSGEHSYLESMSSQAPESYMTETETEQDMTHDNTCEQEKASE